MSRIAAAFARAKHQKRAALITYVCAGDPSLEVIEGLIPRLLEAGADIVELGVPFSDPLADGPVIQGASQRALERHVHPHDVLALVQRVRARGCEVPIVLMGYMNPIVSRGVASYCDEAARGGVDGLIVPDLPLEEADEVGIPAARSGLDLILLAAPTTPPARLERIAQRTRGFLYFVSVTGVTGARGALPAELPAQLALARRLSAAPVAVGFGVSTPAQAAELAQLADGVIVGSALVQAIAENERGIETGLSLVRSLARGLNTT